MLRSAVHWLRARHSALPPRKLPTRYSVVWGAAVACELQIPFDGPYGTKSEKMACPLSALIEARFTDFTQEQKDYPDVSVLEKKFVSVD